MAEKNELFEKEEKDNVNPAVLTTEDEAPAAPADSDAPADKLIIK